MLTLRAENARSSPTGSLHAALESGYGALEAQSDFALRPNESLALENLALVARGLRVAGSAAVRVDSKLVDAELAGEFSDLTALSPLVGGQVSGSGAAHVVLTSAHTQAVEVTAHLEDFSYKGGFDLEAGRLELEAGLRGLGSEPGGRLRVKASDMFVGAVVLSSVDVEADGTAGRFDLRANGEGRHIQAFRLRTAAVLDARRGTRAARIRSFEGEIGGRALRLERELVVAGVNRGLSVEQLDVSLADARVLHGT